MALGLFGDALGGIGRGVQAIGRGFTGLINRGVNNQLGMIGIDSNMLTDQQRSALRSDFLSRLGSGIQGMNIAGGMQGFQQDAQAMGQQAAQQQFNSQLSSIMSRTDIGNDEKYRMAGDLYSSAGMLDRAKNAYDIAQRLQAPQDEAIGTPFDRTINGKAYTFQRFKSGKVQAVAVDGQPLTPMPDKRIVDQGGTSQVIDLNSTAPGTTFERTLTPGEQKTDERWQQTRDYQKERDAITDAHWRQDSAQRAAGLRLRQQRFDANEGALDRTAQALAGGDLTRIRDIASLRSDQRLRLFDRVKQLNPKFNVAEIDRKVKMEDYYANGKGADNLRSFGTFLEHGGAASDAVNGIRNSTTSKWINKPINWWRENMQGSPEYQNLMGALEPVRKEFESFLLGGRALYSEDRLAAEKILSEHSSPAVIQQALKTLGHTAKARFNEENYRYRRIMGRDLQDPFSPEAIGGARRIGVDLGVSAPEAPTGPAEYWDFDSNGNLGRVR